MWGLVGKRPVALLGPVQWNGKDVSPFACYEKVDFFLDMRGSYQFGYLQRKKKRKMILDRIECFNTMDKLQPNRPSLLPIPHTRVVPC